MPFFHYISFYFNAVPCRNVYMCKGENVFSNGLYVWPTGDDAAGEQGNAERRREGEDQDSAASSLSEPFSHRAPSGQPAQSPEIWQQSLRDRLRQHKGSFPLRTGQDGAFVSLRQIKILQGL